MLLMPHPQISHFLKRPRAPIKRFSLQLIQFILAPQNHHPQSPTQPQKIANVPCVTPPTDQQVFTCARPPMIPVRVCVFRGWLIFGASPSARLPPFRGQFWAIPVRLHHVNFIHSCHVNSGRHVARAVIYGYGHRTRTHGTGTFINFAGPFGAVGKCVEKSGKPETFRSSQVGCHHLDSCMRVVVLHWTRRSRTLRETDWNCECSKVTKFGAMFSHYRISFGWRVWHLLGGIQRQWGS